MNNKPLIQIILGSTRAGRQGAKVAQWVHNEAKKRSRWDTELLDLVDYPLPFYDEPASPSTLKGVYSNPVVQKWVDTVTRGDGYILVTPEYNHSFPAVLKNALDYPYVAWHRKPVAFVSYSDGTGAGIRAVEQLRNVVADMQLAQVKSAVHIPLVKTTVGDNATVSDITIIDKLKLLFEDLAWWTVALKNARR